MGPKRKGQRQGYTAGGTGVKKHDLCLFFIKIKKIQCNPPPDVIEIIKERLKRTTVFEREIDLTGISI